MICNDRRRDANRGVRGMYGLKGIEAVILMCLNGIMLTKIQFI